MALRLLPYYNKDKYPGRQWQPVTQQNGFDYYRTRNKLCRLGHANISQECRSDENEGYTGVVDSGGSAGRGSRLSEGVATSPV